MTREKIHARSETADQAQTSRTPGETFQPRSGSELPESALPKKTQLDFSKLDLSVEKVDERISPSETNVFDK